MRFFCLQRKNYVTKQTQPTNHFFGDIQNPDTTMKTPSSIPINPYVSRMTFPSGMVPKIMNKTTGSTPYPDFARNIRRKSDYSSTGRTVLNVNRGKLLSSYEQNNYNKLLYEMLSDGVMCYFPARRRLGGAYGYLDPLINTLVDSLSDKNSRWVDMLKRLQITAVLPIKDMKTGVAKSSIMLVGLKRSM